MKYHRTLNVFKSSRNIVFKSSLNIPIIPVRIDIHVHVCIFEVKV